MPATHTTLVFRRGAWIPVDTAFLADPGLTEAQRRVGASAAANWLARGHPRAAAEAAAERVVYAAAYPGLDWVAGK
jgi:hypothetical protein